MAIRRGSKRKIWFYLIKRRNVNEPSWQPAAIVSAQSPVLATQFEAHQGNPQQYQQDSPDIHGTSNIPMNQLQFDPAAPPMHEGNNGTSARPEHEPTTSRPGYSGDATTQSCRDSPADP
ncbi:hypothetical protein Aspvir_003395 [Aspergillus viridinutans]|uniref:Chromo domain-containing protein n=1 Tax=Aspergillus viridinutans TaxID=75553 RepID=A0A9P3C7Q8_ASPVI|nr:uncharacterized protein Aspvir_003395 [Aspergillus viridinutans]GIK07728.1 hypothetical protein Aspvir_003395 [Aspergillus viridinutans]